MTTSLWLVQYTKTGEVHALDPEHSGFLARWLQRARQAVPSVCRVYARRPLRVWRDEPHRVTCARCKHALRMAPIQRRPRRAVPVDQEHPHLTILPAEGGA